MAATASNVLGSETFFRFGILMSLIIEIVNVFVALAVFHVLKPVDKKIASLMVILYLIPVPVALLNQLNQFALLSLVHDSTVVSGFTADQIHGLMALLLNVQSAGNEIAYVFYGLWLFPMGYLIFRSGFAPRTIGILVVMSGCGYLLQSCITVLYPNFEWNIGTLTMWGELIFPLWLVIRGVNVAQWKQRALAPALG
jgi:hypothetical protein